MADPISQIFAQAGAASADGANFGGFFSEGVQQGQRRRSMDMQERHANEQSNFSRRRLEVDERQEERLSALAPLQEAALKLRNQATGLEISQAMDNQKADIAVGVLAGQLSQTGEWGTPASWQHWNQITDRFPLAAVTKQGQLFMQQQRLAIANKQLVEKFGGATKVTVPTPEGGEATFGGAETVGAASPVGKELADYHAALKSGDTEAAGLIKSAILARSQKDGFSVEFGEDGRVTRIAQGAAGGKSDLPASVIADAQQTSNNAVDVVNYGKELIRLASDPANTGILGNLNRLTVKLGGQLDPSMDPGEAFDFATQTAFFKSRITKLLKSDSNIAEAEREAIVEKLPGPEWHKSTPQNVAEAKKAMIEVAKSARNQIKAAKRPLPPELMTPREILDNVKNGNLKLTNKETARLMKESLFQGPDFADME